MPSLSHLLSHLWEFCTGRIVARQVELVHTSAQEYVNFTVDGHNTYYVVGDAPYLTHNCIDDPFSEKDIINGNTDVFEDAWTWFQSGPLQRLAPDGAAVIIHTRWSKVDLIGKLIDQMANNPDTDQWEIIEFPAIINEDTPEAKSLWPERWPLDTLLQKKAVMAPYLWNAQYMQNPTGEAGALIKREWWKDWEKEDPPKCEYVIMALDAAQEAHTRADYNACQVWGVFYDEREKANIIMLNAWKKRMEYPELKKAMLDAYAEWEPDTLLIEKKSSGSVLFQEFRNAGIPVSEFTPGKGNDKIARVNSVSDIFSSGLVWAPLARRWAQDVVEECSDFPNGAHDDQCFVAGTQISMADGSTKAIERVVVGDQVSTPFGACSVTAAGPTGLKRVYSYAGLTGTANHPIATSLGWTPLLALNRGSAILIPSSTGELSWLQKIQISVLRMWYLMASRTTATRTVKTQPTDDTSCAREVENYCTGLYGSSSKGQYLEDGIYTISTETPPTTVSATSPVSRGQRTALSTKRLCLRMRTALSNWSIWRRLDRSPQRGTVARKGWFGTANTQKNMGLGSAPTHEDPVHTHVLFAGFRLSRVVQNLPSVLACVQIRSLGNQQKPEYPANAYSALQGLFPDTPPEVLRSAAKNVKTRTGLPYGKPSAWPKKQVVYNLSVAGYPCYIANGVLVHNCDAMTLALRRFRTGGFIRLSTDAPDEESGFRSKRQYY